MHPAFSVIFFTTASGAGFGLCAWFGLLALMGNLPSRGIAMSALLLGAALAAAGLLSSLAHLGQPQRAWRALSQWRSSWLSREGVFSVLLFVPVAVMLWLLWRAPAQARLDSFAAAPALALAGGVLLVLALACVVCTAMIYHSLKPIPAWRHPLVVPVYLAFSLFTGGLVLAAVLALGGSAVPDLAAFAMLVGAVALWRMKRGIWNWIDTGRLPVTRNAALGLPPVVGFAGALPGFAEGFFDGLGRGFAAFPLEPVGLDGDFPNWGNPHMDAAAHNEPPSSVSRIEPSASTRRVLRRPRERASRMVLWTP